MIPAIDLLFAFLVALVFSLVLVVLFGKRGPGPLAGFPFFFVILFFSVWAIGAWVEPFGPSLWGRSWLTFVLVGAVFALLLAAVIPARPKEKVLDLQRPEQKRATRVLKIIFGLFFWVVVLVLLGAIITHYIWRIA